MCPLSPKLKNSAHGIEYENNFTDNDVGLFGFRLYPTLNKSTETDPEAPFD